MKIIHCSDLHLDSKMQTNLTASQARTRQKEILKTFARLCEYADKNDVSAVLICGDMFDTQNPSPQTEEYCVSCIKNCAKTEFYLIFGNHDEESVFSRISLPNLHTFSSQTSYEQGEITVSGFNDGQCDFDKLNLPADKINIVMAHGQETLYDNTPDGVNVARARDKNIDYLALGHLHSSKAVKLDSRGIYAYSGCLEGRGFDETGEKGFILLETKGKKLATHFVHFATRSLYEIKVDISGIEEYYAIENLVASEVAHIGEKDIVRIVLVGTYTLSTRKDLKMLEELVLNRFFSVQLLDETTLYIDPKVYEKDISLKGEFIRTVYASNLPEKDKDRIITLGIKALAGEVEE